MQGRGLQSWLSSSSSSSFALVPTGSRSLGEQKKVQETGESVNSLRLAVHKERPLVGTAVGEENASPESDGVGFVRQPDGVGLACLL